MTDTIQSALDAYAMAEADLQTTLADLWDLSGRREVATDTPTECEELCEQ